MNNQSQREHSAHHYETSRPWSVAGLSTAATAAILLVTSGISHAVRPLDGGAIAAQLRLLAQQEIGAVESHEGLGREDSSDDGQVADQARHEASPLLHGAGGTSAILFNEGLP